jgi:hypothetical protein
MSLVFLSGSVEHVAAAFFVSVIRQLDFRDRFEAFVSASQNHVSRLRRPALAKTGLSAASMGGKAEHLALLRPLSNTKTANLIGRERRNRGRS